MKTAPTITVGQNVLLRQRKTHPHPDILHLATITKLLGGGRMLVQFGPGEVEVYAGPNEAWKLDT